MDNQIEETCHDVLDYIGDLTSELAKMAKAVNCDKLAFILGLAAIEAEQIAKAQLADADAADAAAPPQTVLH